MSSVHDKANEALVSEARETASVLESLVDDLKSQTERLRFLVEQMEAGERGD